MSREDEQARKDRNEKMWEARRQRWEAWKKAQREAKAPKRCETCGHDFPGPHFDHCPHHDPAF